MKRKNPFRVYGYPGPDLFCDRVKETEKIISALENGRNLTLIAPRRIGKSGLIHHVFNRLGQAGSFKCVYFDIYSVRTQAEFAAAFASAVFTQLESGLEKAFRSAVGVLGRCRPVITIDEVSGLPKLTFSVDRCSADIAIGEVFDYLAKREDEDIVIAIDEFQQVAEFPEKGVEAALRSRIQFLQNVRFIFAGSRRHMMAEMFLSPKRPFYHSTQNISIDVIDEDTYYQFAEGFFAEEGLELSRKVFGYLYGKFDGVTWDVQAVLNRLYATGESVTDASSVDCVVSELVEEYNWEYARIVEDLGLNALMLARAIAAERCVKEVMASAFILKYSLPTASSVRQALKQLEAREIVYRSDNGYSIYDRLMRYWLIRK